LLRLLRDAGAEVAFGDVDRRASDRVQAELGMLALAPEAIYETDCDIFAPCALGAILSDETIPRLRCQAVVGSANNQLATLEDAVRLRERDILYAPDFVVNSGGAIHLIGRETLGWSEEETLERIPATIREALAEVYALAEEQSITTTTAAERVAEQRLATGRVEARQA